VKGEDLTRQRLSLIVAMARNRVIGRDGKLPWHLSADLKRFKTLTLGHHIIMGRKTWESIGRPLPGRTSIVITRQPAYSAPGAYVADSLSSALKLARHDPEVFVIGGGQIYRAALPLADRIYATEVDAEFAGDTFFPAISSGEWHVSTREHSAAEGAQPGSLFVVYERRGSEPGKT
jgi:dihydrofolate reductase